jgi:hypothetical protein
LRFAAPWPRFRRVFILTGIGTGVLQALLERG